MLTLLNRMGNSLRSKLGEKEDEQIILPFNRVQRRGDGLYYDTSEGIPYSGAIRRWRSEQEISDHIEFRNGVLHGSSIRWYPSGSILSHHSYRPTKLRLQFEIHYVCGQKHGLETKWYFDGKQSHHSEYKLGLKHGLQIQWFHTGQKRSEMVFEDGCVCDGTWHRWHANGNLAAKDKYRDNRKIRRQMWHPDGELYVESTY
jgi:antitoxin component YwqK of YwqJK toxin-antitoxin module